MAVGLPFDLRILLYVSLLISAAAAQAGTKSSKRGLIYIPPSSGKLLFPSLRLALSLVHHPRALNLDMLLLERIF